jgi:ureidoglycolate dehydrogenase (NAD+)
VAKILYEKLLDFHQIILKKVGLDKYSANAVSIGLCETSLRGIDSHGVRLLPFYVDSALSGRKNPKPDFKFKKTFPAIGHLNADDAFGHAAGMKAIDYGMEMANEVGLGAVAVSNSSHPGAMASMALKAARKGYIAFAFTHADSLLLSHGGVRPYFGTNPICMAVPRVEDEPYCIDMAPTFIPWNRVKMHRNEDLPLPNNRVADESGDLTNDPHKARCLIPIGTYKGYALSSMVEVLCGVYTGMAFGRHIPVMFEAPMEEPRKLGQFYMVMKTNGVIGENHFLERMQQMTDEVRNEPNIPDETVMLPGDPQTKEAKKRLKDGIPLDTTTLAAFKEMAEKHDAPLELI